MSLSTESVGDFLKKNPISVSCAVLSVALLITSYVRSDYAAEETAVLEQKTTEASRLAANKKNADQLKEHFDSLVAAQKQVEARLIDQKDLTANSQYFYQLETETGVKLTEPRPSAAPKRDPKFSYLPVPFAVTVQGEYPQLLDFLRHLENGPHYCRVLSANCGAGADRAAQLTLNLNLELLALP
jgi:hypothetical protein